jgi:hypothetical protein
MGTAQNKSPPGGLGGQRMTTRTFYRTVFQVEVLSEGPYPQDAELDDIQADIMYGPCSGEIHCLGVEELNGKQAAEALLGQHSCPSFFRIDDEGNDLETA